MLSTAQRSLPSSVLSLVLLCVLPQASRAAVARACPAGAPIAAFKLTAKPTGGGPALPVSGVNVLGPGETLVYDPVGSAFTNNKRASIAVILIPEDGSTLPMILPARRAGVRAEWPVTVRAAAIGVVLGPRGIDEKKLKTLLREDPAAVDRLADYADQTSKAEALVQVLSKYEQSSPGSGSLQSVLNGFSSQYGVNLPTLDRTKPVDQQASALVRAITPALSADQSRPSLVQQSGGLAASVASLFFGPPAGLAIGGAALVGSLHASMFPPSDFQSAFTQPGDGGGLALCTSAAAHDSRARAQFVWLLRLPDTDPPRACHADTAHVPAGWIGTITIHCASVAQLKALPHLHDWRLVSGAATVVPTTTAITESSDELTVDLKKVRVQPGEYRLEATWDWTPLPVAGTVHVWPLGDFSGVTVAPKSQDFLVAGSGMVNLELAGADFEFLDHAAITSAAHRNVVTPLAFTLPKGRSAGEQRTATVSLDTHALAAGPYLIQLTQINGNHRDIPIAIHPVNPTLARLPLRANIGDAHQTVRLHGTSLERIDRIASSGATWTLAPVAPGARDVTEREADIQLDGSVHAGDRVPILLFVEDLHEPLEVGGALEIAGPRPGIVRADASIPGGSGVEVRRDELPAGTPVSFVLQTRGAGAHPIVRLACDRDPQAVVTVDAAEKTGGRTLGFIGQDTLFLSLDPGTVGFAGCALGATVTDEATGTSDPYALGRIVLLPRIDAFTIASDKLGDTLYAGTLVGEGLELIEKTGWNAKDGFAVQGIATPVRGQSGKQTLAVAVPWPPPAPHAPLFIWLRGEHEGRATSAKY